MADEQRLETMRRALACLRRALGHDLPNQMVAVRGLVQILDLEEQDRLSPTGRDYLRRLSSAAERTHTAMRALEELARESLLETPADPETLTEIVREAAAEVNQLCPGRAIEYHFPESSLLIRLPQTVLRRVLVHLIRNGVQAVEDSRRPRIEVRGQRTTAGVEIAIVDNGRGLAPEQLRRVQGFFAGREAKVPGPGLGLLLVRQALEAWGGAVVVRSEPGHGSVFTLMIPGANPDG
jgi:signal transduction histidine kinase